MVLDVSDDVKEDICRLTSFESTNDTEAWKMIEHSPGKSCATDRMPTCFFKKCLDPIVSFLTHSINISRSGGTVPPSMKEAFVTPLIKKVHLDPREMNNLRPVSNLSYFLKALDWIVTSSGSHEVMQSNYRKSHSTETALICMQMDILCAIDTECLLVLLDLPAAFDTVDHKVLLNNL